MLLRMVVYFCVVWAFGDGQQTLDHNEGDICKQTEGKTWTCKALRSCPNALADLKTNKSLQFCRFMPARPIVCCEPSENSLLFRTGLESIQSDICKQTEGKTWTCKALRSCPKALADLKTNKSLQYCPFKHGRPIVCCEPSENSQKLCNPLVAISMDINCQYNGRDVPCSKRMKPNTTAVANCKQHYREIYTREYDSLVCQDNGEWSSMLFYCAPDCGVGLTSLILHGSPTHQGEFPWVAALYMKDKRDMWDQACGGTLITPHIVLTAGHCLVPEHTNEIIEPENIRVGLGKYHRDYYKNETFSIISYVREVVVPRFYSGRPTNFALDIGLIDLVTSVQLTAYIMPACMHSQSAVTINTGTIGHVAGWGKTENGTSSDVLLSTNLTYVDDAECIQRVGLGFKSLVTHDKFCAEEDSNGGQVAKGDSGCGLTVVEKGLHFVVGVVSTKISGENLFSFFTDLSNPEHHQWLQDQKFRLTRLHNET